MGREFRVGALDCVDDADPYSRKTKIDLFADRKRAVRDIDLSW